MADNLRPKRPHKKAPSVALTADKALTEALSIVREARDADEEIPWRKDPQNDQDAALRAGFIRHTAAELYSVIEAGQLAMRELSGVEPSEEELAHDAATVARFVSWKLEALLSDPVYDGDGEDDDTDSVGCDLKEAIDHWAKVANENFALAKRLERQRIFRAAKADISGGQSYGGAS